jgi:hypothetical protein
MSAAGPADAGSVATLEAVVGDGGGHIAPTTAAASSAPAMVLAFVCRTCAKGFPTAAALGGRSSKLCGQLKHQCGKCRARFARKRELHRHRCEEEYWYEVVVADVCNTQCGNLKLSDADTAGVKLALGGQPTAATRLNVRDVLSSLSPGRHGNRKQVGNIERALRTACVGENGVPATPTETTSALTGALVSSPDVGFVVQGQDSAGSPFSIIKFFGSSYPKPPS